MKLYRNTSVYQETIKTLDTIFQLLEKSHPSALRQKLENELINLSSYIAVALEEKQVEEMDKKLRASSEQINQLFQLSNLAAHRGEISNEQNLFIETQLESLWQKILSFPQKRRNILILSSVLGQGHMSASKAIKQGLEYLYGRDYNISIIDFYEEIGSLFNKATVKAYEGSTKHLPAVYKAFFEGTDAKWPVQLLNLVNYPLNAAKIEKVFKSHNPHIIISAFPVWDYLAKLLIKKLGGIKFVSVVTDSISIHHAWISGTPDFQIVANTETAISIKKMGGDESKIKILGFPVRREFSTPINRHDFIKNLNLNPNLYTTVLLPTSEKVSNTEKMIEEITSEFPNNNLIVICGRDAELYPKLEAYDHLKNTRIIGWTDQMPEFIKSADLVITKAGGATVMECLAAKKPMIITQVIPGQEMGNAELIKLHELGIIQKDAKMSIPECIRYIQKNQVRFLKNLGKNSNPEANINIAKFINELI